MAGQTGSGLVRKIAPDEKEIQKHKDCQVLYLFKSLRYISAFAKKLAANLNLRSTHLLKLK